MYNIIQRKNQISKELNPIHKNMGIKVDETNSLSDESNRVSIYAGNSINTLIDIDKEFRKQTELNDVDMKFLWFAVVLQILRQEFLTKFPERLNDKEASDKVKNGIKEHSNRSHSYYNPSLEQIINNPVSYDTMDGSPKFNLGLAGINHRTKTLGHDPILGWLFGTANIATSTLTTTDFRTFHIKTGNIMNRDMIVKNAITTKMIKRFAEKMLYEGFDGMKKISASIVKQAIHLQSDINSKKSLPFPIIPTLSMDLSNKLAEYGIDTANIICIGKQTLYTKAINSLISMLHRLTKDDNDSNKLFEVRTRKIISTSNLVASSCNIIKSSFKIIRDSINPTNTIKKDVFKKYNIDVGGFIETFYRLIKDVKYQQEIRKEFIYGNYMEKIHNGDGVYHIE